MKAPEHTPEGDPDKITCRRCGTSYASHRMGRKRVRTRTPARQAYDRARQQTRSARPEHVPEGDPCARCQKPAHDHRIRKIPRKPRVRPEHTPEGDPCARCDTPAEIHCPDRVAYQKARPKRDRGGREKRDQVIIGVDGEGQDTPDGRHIYTYLAAVTEHGELVAEAYNPKGLSHEECAIMILSIRRNAIKFGFMFSYDITKICEQMPLEDRYYLMRPQARQAWVCRLCKERFTGPPECPECASHDLQGVTTKRFYRGRKYDVFMGSLTISKKVKGVKQPQSTKIWDCFRFFGCAFVEAIKNWDVGTEDQRARIADMKAKRGAFDVEDPEAVKAYCREECHLLAVMMRKVIDAHEKAGIPLTRYEGAGSTASALLKKYEVQKYKGPRLREMPTALAHAIASAFFGGRFENSTIGKVEKPIEGFDVSSAYPYALSFLPCLSCGEWTRVDLPRAKLLKAIEKAQLACVRFRVKGLPPADRKKLAWAPLPFRDEKGSIAYGLNCEGWAWKQEFLPALKGWPDLVEPVGEAWIYKTTCKHKPFGFLPPVYRERVRWGKDGAGIVLKLGPNATYGKTAQTLGEDPPYQSWVWAGNCTATTRGQLLQGISSAKDPWDVLALATDGISATCMLSLDKPKDTGTGDLPKPLGGWEHKHIPEGMFLAKPGVYYRLRGEIADVRARGVGRRELHAQSARVMAGFAAWDREDFKHHVSMTSRRFYGAKSSITGKSACVCGGKWVGVPSKGCPKCGLIGTVFETRQAVSPEGKNLYGTWDLRTIKVGFDPHPKRERRLKKGGSYVRLHLRDLGGQISAPYDVGAALTTPEGMAQRDAKEFALEQPDWEEDAHGEP